jgi:DNA-directed RNA polymerase subunit E'/Rpb7
MSYLTHNDIYFHTQINRRVSLNPRFLNVDFAKYIEKIVKNNVEGRCIREGYVVPGTTIVLERSMGNLNNNQFNGNILYDVKIGVKICNIPMNSVVKAPIIKMNKLGLLAELGPLMIIVPKEIHNNKDAFKDIKIGDEIELLIIGKTFELNSKKISVYAKLNTSGSNKMKIIARKGEKNTQNMVNKVDDSSIFYKNVPVMEETDETLDKLDEDEDVEREDDEDDAEVDAEDAEEVEDAEEDAEEDDDEDENNSDINEELDDDAELEEEDDDELENNNEVVGELDENEDPLEEDDGDEEEEEEEEDED